MFLKTIFVLLFSLAASAQDAYVTAKVADGRIDKYVTLLRQAFQHETGEDPFHGKLAQDLVFDLSYLLRQMGPDAKTWIQDIESLMKIDIFAGKIELRIKGFSYHLKDQNSSFKVLSEMESFIHWCLTSRVQGLDLSAEEIKLVAVFNRPNLKPIEIDLQLMAPVIQLSSHVKTPMESFWQMGLDETNLGIEINRLDLLSLVEDVASFPEKLQMTFERFLMPTVSVEIGRKVIHFDNNKIEQYIRRNLDVAKVFILDLILKKYPDRLSTIFTDKPMQLSSPRAKYFPQAIKTAVWINDLAYDPSQLVIFGARLMPCEDTSTNYDDCIQKPVISPFEKIQKDFIEFALSKFPEEADMMVSISQKSINNFLHASVIKGMWDKILSEEKLSWAPLGTFLYTKNVGETFDLYLDVIYTFERTERIMTGRSSIRFPIKFKVKLLIEKDNGKTFFRLIVAHALYDANFVLHGIPALGLISTVDDIPRFKKKVLGQIQDKIKKFANQTLLDVELPELVGLVVERVDFMSDAKGNLHGFFDLEEPTR
jgi:hypothetical protein